MAYGLGMALVLMVLTLGIALAKQGLVRSFRGILPYINRIAGGLLIVAGAYLVYYGWYENQTLSGASDPGGVAASVAAWNASLASWVSAVGPLRIGLVLVAIIAVAVLLASSWRGGSSPRSGTRRTRSREARDGASTGTR